MVNGRVVGLRCHPLTYAESLLTVLAVLLPRLVMAELPRVMLLFIEGWLVLAALLFSQSRSPWLGAVTMIGVTGRWRSRR